MQLVKHISPRAEQLISEYDLGHVKAEYKENLLKSGLVTSVALLAGLICLIIAFQAWSDLAFLLYRRLYLS